MTLTHADLPNEEERAGHRKGWEHYLAQLDGVATREEMRGKVEVHARNYFAAWSEARADERLRLLERCCAADFAFMDPYARITGLAALNGHVANAQQLMPGHTLEPNGEIRICHGHAVIPWRAKSREGHVIASGQNFTELAPDGRLAKVVGFWD